MSVMRSFLSIAAFALAASALCQGWNLKAPYEAKAKHSWQVVVTANVGGMDVEAKMKQHVVVDSVSEKEIKATASWTDLLVNGSEQQDDDSSWALVLNPNGSLVSAGEHVDYARMLTPAAFVYPGKEVKVGDKWTSKVKPKDGKEITSDYEVVEIAKVGDVEAMKVKLKLSEEAPKDGVAMKAEGFHWVAKDGKVLKFELDIKNWIVPMAQGMPEFDAKVKGELIKS